ncbi:MAG: hypothetical protein HDR04_06905 [Lachnospiraceae bacterium]|nr:hypothetical protein [Lachnospiraceae bacterium]
MNTKMRKRGRKEKGIITTLFLLCFLPTVLAGCAGAQSSKSYKENETGGKVLRVGMECAYAPNNWEEDRATDTNLPI